MSIPLESFKNLRIFQGNLQSACHNNLNKQEICSKKQVSTNALDNSNKPLFNLTQPPLMKLSAKYYNHVIGFLNSQQHAC